MARLRTQLRCRSGGSVVDAVVWLACALGLGGASAGPSPEVLAVRQNTLARQLASRPPEATAEALVVRLVFDADADLDLYVTDPGAETVYFGNSPSGGGGRLLVDQRCDAPTPRVETVVFAQRTRGTVRVGVDAPERCRNDVRAVPFVVELRAGEQRVEQPGVAIPGRFEVLCSKSRSTAPCQAASALASIHEMPRPLVGGVKTWRDAQRTSNAVLDAARASDPGSRRTGRSARCNEDRPSRSAG